MTTPRTLAAEETLAGRACSLAGDNSPRFDPRRGGQVESYFLRANHPTERLAIWLKATVLAPQRRWRLLRGAGSAAAPTAALWCIVFDGERRRVWGDRMTVPLAQARFGGQPLQISLGDNLFRFGDGGEAHGGLGQGDDGARWALRFAPVDSPAARPLSLFPSPALIDGGFPRSKLLTPYPLLRFDGEIHCGGRRIAVERWLGMQGHNWGAEHAWEYAWGQCIFVDGAGEPLAVAEGFSSRIKLAGLVVPRMSSLVVRRGDRSYRFDRLFDPWRQRAEIGDLRWTVQLRGRAGEAQLTLAARPDEVVCLGYRNPDGRLSYCLNSRLAAAHLRVNPMDEEGFECHSAHGAALELLQDRPDPRFAVI